MYTPRIFLQMHILLNTHKMVKKTVFMYVCIYIYFAFYVWSYIKHSLHKVSGKLISDLSNN